MTGATCDGATATVNVCWYVLLPPKVVLPLSVTVTVIIAVPVALGTGV